MSKLGLTRPTVAIELCTNLGLVAEHDRLSAALVEAKMNAAQADRMNSPVGGIATKIRDLETQMRADTVVFTLGALPRKQWAELEAAHPERPGVELDKQFSVNMSTFIEAVMATPGTIVEVIRKETGEAVDFTGADWADEAEEMSDGQWTRFAVKLLEINRGSKPVPFNRAASAQTRRSEPNSK